MSEPSAERRRAVGGTAVSALLPGLGQILAGRWPAGVPALTVWLGLLWVAVARFGRARSALRGPWDARLAVAVLALGLVVSWTWSLRDARGAVRRRRAGTSQWRLTLLTFARNRTALLGLMAIGALFLMVSLAPLLAPFDPASQGSLLTSRLLPPSMLHPLGTDRYARDVLSRLLYGARISLSIGVLAVGLSVTIGTLLGAVAGYLGGLVDTVVMRFVDAVISFPRLVLLLAIVAVFPRSVLLLIAVLGLTLWPSTARIVRGEVLGLREREFIEAARALGYSRRRIILHHLIPNTLGPVIVAATLGIGDTIVLEAGLSFLGWGVRSPTASWGTIVADGRGDLLGAWWISTFAGLAIVLTVLAFNLVGDGLRDALDPRARA